MVALEREIIQVTQHSIEGIKRNILDMSIEEVEPEEKIVKEIPPMIGERRLSHNRHREIIEIEKRIHRTSKEINDTEQERKELGQSGYVERGLMTPKEFHTRKKVLLFHRKWLAGNQKYDRDSIRPDKTPQQVEE